MASGSSTTARHLDGPYLASVPVEKVDGSGERYGKFCWMGIRQYDRLNQYIALCTTICNECGYDSQPRILGVLWGPIPLHWLCCVHSKSSPSVVGDWDRKMAGILQYGGMYCKA